MHEAKQLLLSMEADVNSLRSEVADIANGGAAQDDFACINEQLDDLKEKIRQAICENIDLEEEKDRFRAAYSRYRLEYDKLMNSRSIKALFKAREIAGRHLSVLPPSVMQVDFGVERDDDDDILFTQLVGSVSEPLISSDALENRFDGLQVSNGQRIYEKAPLTVGLISESAIPKWLKESLDVVLLSEDRFETQIDSNQLDAIIVLQGNDASGSGRAVDSKLANWVSSALAYANEKKINTITIRNVSISNSSVLLINSSDHEREMATNTSISRSVAPASNDNIEVWINPASNNPLNINASRSGAASYLGYTFLYRGIWDSEEPIASQECALILNGIVDSPFLDLCIGCPSSLSSIEPLWIYSFPLIYRPYILSTFEYDNLSELGKLFRYHIMMNWKPAWEITYYRDVIESMALGAIVVSNYSRLVSRNALPAFTVFVSEEIRRLVDGYTDQELFNMQVENSRKALSGKTVYDWLNTIFEHIGVDFRFGKRKILLVCSTKKLSSSISKGLLLNEDIEIIERESFDPSKLMGNFDFFFLASDEMLNYEHFLEDALNCFKYTNVDYVTYGSSAEYKDSYRYMNGDAGISDTLYSLKDIEISSLFEPIFRSTLSGFKISPTKWGRQTTGKEKKVGVIIPVYNNGEYLKSRCFPSLLRSSIFGNMQIYLIDDGSNDENTKEVIAKLSDDYDNVVSYRCGDKGSGSASFPRNEGLRLCREPYVTYLDPDNEAIGDGYAKLLQALEADPADFAIGDMIAVMDPPSDSYTICNSYDVGRIDDPRSALIETAFEPKSIQACLINRAFLEQNAIENVIGSVGQDSLFFTEMMLASQSFIYVDAPIHVYYAERQGSVVNSVSHSFFEKSLLTERRQVDVLKKYDVLDQYKSLRLDFFVEYWYKGKLALVADSEKDQCLSIINQICELYA